MNDSNQLFNFEQELPTWAETLLVFDTETTGLDLTKARIVTACAVEIDKFGQPAAGHTEWLANPEIEIPESASNVHGITTEIARRDGRPYREVLSELLETLRSAFARNIPVVAYNAPYDFTILHYQAIEFGLEPLVEPRPVLDPLVLDKKFNQFRSGKRNLERVCEVYGVQLSDAHNATADAVAAGRLMQAMARKHATELGSDINQIHDEQIAISRDRDLSFEKWMQGSKDTNFKIQLGWPLKLDSSNS